MKAIEVECPVEDCKAAIGYLCKLGDVRKNPFFGRFHIDRTQEAGKVVRKNNQERAQVALANHNKEQSAKKFLRTTSRVLVFR